MSAVAHLRKVVVGLLVAVGTLGVCLAGETDSAVPAGWKLREGFFVTAYDSLHWETWPAPDGAKHARLGPADLDLVIWPPGAELEPHRRSDPWVGLVVTGTLELRFDDAESHSAGPLALIEVSQHVAHAVRCASQSPCVFFGFRAQPQLIEESEQGLGDVPETGWNTTDLRALEWSALGVGDGAVAWDPATERPWGSLLYLQVYHLYRFGGRGVPYGTRVESSFGLVLSGTLTIEIDGAGERELPAGSFFLVPPRRQYSTRCLDGPCTILATDPPPQRKE